MQPMEHAEFETKCNLKTCVSKSVCFCYHSTFCKAHIDEHSRNERGISKNTNCTAQLIITVKLTTRWSMLRDSNIKNGMPAKVQVFKRHCHPLNAPSTLKHSSPAGPLRDVFHDYFELRMSAIPVDFIETNSCSKVIIIIVHLTKNIVWIMIESILQNELSNINLTYVGNCSEVLIMDQI